MEELTEDVLDLRYVEENVLTNTDRFLEEQITGSFRKWHVILIASTILAVTGILHMYSETSCLTDPLFVEVFCTAVSHIFPRNFWCACFRANGSTLADRVTLTRRGVEKLLLIDYYNNKVQT